MYIYIYIYIRLPSYQAEVVFSYETNVVVVVFLCSILLLLLLLLMAAHFEASCKVSIVGDADNNFNWVTFISGASCYCFLNATSATMKAPADALALEIAARTGKIFATEEFHRRRFNQQ